MALEAKHVIYIVAALALTLGILAYSVTGIEHEHEEEGLLEGDLVKVVAVGSVLAVIAGVSFIYLLKSPSEEK